MKASEIFHKRPALDSRALPSLDDIARSVKKVMRQWPDAVKKPNNNQREHLAQEMLRRVGDWSWDGIHTSWVTTAALAVFDEERRARQELEPVRRFFADEIRARPAGPFHDAMVWIYIETFDQDAEHTQLLAGALTDRREEIGGRARQLIEKVSDLFVPSEVAKSLGSLMANSPNPYDRLKELGFRSPHAPGLTHFCHKAFVREIAPRLKDKLERDRLFRWLVPEGGTTLQTDAAFAVEALLRPWKDETPSDEVRHEISEAVIGAYKDPRLHNGGIWSGFDPELRTLFLRWLTKQDMKFFCDMVSATQNSHMWPPRRDFWLDLYDDGMIDEAWVAFGSSAMDYARHHLLKSGNTDLRRRFGRQLDRSGSTSLLIMRIGNKIIVDGCHNYRTHIFKRDDPNTPKLYGHQYYCDDIMRQSKNAKSHSSIPSWKDWVNRHV